MGFQLPRVASPDEPLRLAVLISGGGSGMEALLKQQQSTYCSHKTTIVISNVKDVGGLKIAMDYGVGAEAIEHFPTNSTMHPAPRQKHEEMIHGRLTELDIEVVILSGYMRILSPWFVERWEGRLLNIHPSLLPKFPGAHAHKDVLDSGEKITGCTVHFVDMGVDSGRIIAQREVIVEQGDTIETLSERVKKVEHVLYPEIIDALAMGKLSQQT